MRLARLEALVQSRQAARELEDAMQSPLGLEDWSLKPPERIAAVKERKDV